MSDPEGLHESAPCAHDAVHAALERDARDEATAARLAALDATIAAYADKPALEDRAVVAHALHDRVRVLFALQRRPDALETLADLRRRFGEAEPPLRRWVLFAHFGAASGLTPPERVPLYEAALPVAERTPADDARAAELLFAIGKCGSFRAPEDPLVLRSNAALDELERRFLASRDPAVAAWVLEGALLRCGREWPESEETAARCARLVEAWGQAEPALAELALAALAERGRRLLARDAELAGVVLDDALRRFDALGSPRAQATLAGCALNRALARGRTHGPEAEIAAYAALEERFFGSPWPAVQRWVVAAAENRARTLAPLGQQAEAREVLARALARFGPAREPPELVQAVAKAARYRASLGG